MKKLIKKFCFSLIFLGMCISFNSCSALLPALVEPMYNTSSGGEYHKCWGCKGTGYSSKDAFGNKVKCPYCNGTGWKRTR